MALGSPARETATLQPNVTAGGRGRGGLVGYAQPPPGVLAAQAPAPARQTDRGPAPPQANLTKSQNEFKIVLKGLEDSLLARLSAASGNFLGDTALVENLETTKHTAREIEEKVGARGTRSRGGGLCRRAARRCPEPLWLCPGARGQNHRIENQ